MPEQQENQELDRNFKSITNEHSSADESTKGNKLSKKILEENAENLELDFEVDINIKEIGEEPMSDKIEENEESKQEVKLKSKKIKEDEEDGEISDEASENGDGEISDKDQKDESDGEITDDDEKKDEGEISEDDDGLEDGELKEAVVPNNKTAGTSRQVCRFFNQGRCSFGQLCRFLHVSYNSRGNYSMFPTNCGPLPPLPMNEAMFMRENPRFMPPSQENFFIPPPPPPLPPIERPSAVENAWEHELYATKELMEKSKYTRRGNSFSPDFDDKVPENEKENKNYGRRKERYDDDMKYVYGESNWKQRNYNNFESASNNDYNNPTFRENERSRSFRRNQTSNDRERNKNKFSRDKKRSRSRSGSYSDKSSHSSNSRSSSLSSWESSRSPSPHSSPNKSPKERILTPKYENPAFAKDPVSEKRNERYSRGKRDYPRSLSRSRSRSISMDSISEDTGSSSGSDSDKPPRIPILSSQNEIKGSAFRLGVKRPLSPPSPKESSFLPKQGINSRRDDLLKQLKAVEDAIARKRGKPS